MAETEDNIYAFANSRDPLLGFNWKTVYFGFDPSLDLRYIEKVSIPYQRYESIPIYTGGKNNYYHSVNDIDALSITFYEDTDLTITRMLKKWTDLVQKDGYYGLPANYKKMIMFILIKPDGSGSRLFQAVGAWPASIDNMELDSDSSNRISITASFPIDGLNIFEISGDTNNITERLKKYGSQNESTNWQNLLGLAPNTVNNDDDASLDLGADSSAHGFTITDTGGYQNDAINANAGYPSKLANVMGSTNGSTNIVPSSSSFSFSGDIPGTIGKVDRNY